MTLYIFVGLAIVVTLALLLVSAIYLKRALPVAVPIVVAIWWYMVAVQVPNALGYPINYKFVGTSEAVVLAEMDAPNATYFLVRFIGDSDPRLVIVPYDPNNKEQKKQRQTNSGSQNPIVVFNKSNVPAQRISLQDSQSYGKNNP